MSVCVCECKVCVHVSIGRGQWVYDVCVYWKEAVGVNSNLNIRHCTMLMRNS